MRGEARDLEKTLKSFQKEARSIARTTRTAPPASRRLLRTAGITFLALQAFFIIVPPFTFPVQGTVSSSYTVRVKPDAFGIEAHKGIDIAVPSGTAVRSTAPGRVAAVGYTETAGNYVLVRHLFGFSSYYAHLQSTSAAKGSISLFKVLPIGRAGSTGRSTGSHVHFELRFLGVRIPPRPFLVYHSIRNSIFG